MKNGNWIPISKNFINTLPKDRPYTKLEAAYCLQLDYDNNNKVTVSGYSDLWQWSRKKVSLFFDKMGIEIIYPEATQKIKNQRGYIKLLSSGYDEGHITLHKRDIKGTYKGHIRLIDFSTLQTEKNIKGTYKGHKRDIKGSTTIEPIILNPKEEKKYIKEKHLEFVFLTKDEYEKLLKEFGDAKLKRWIETLNNYIGSKGKKYKSHYHTILNWERRENPTQPKKYEPTIEELIS